MSADVTSSENAMSHNLPGSGIASFGWKAALAHAQELALSKGERATIAFLDEARFAGSLFRRGHREISKGELLLPSGGAFLRLLLKLVWRRQPTARFSPTRFISALLTYVAEPRRIGLIGNDKGRLEALCAHFGRHAPWHEFVVIGTDASLPGRLDLVIVDTVAERDIGHRLDGADIGLVIMAGRGLHRLAQPRRPANAAQTSIPKPSLA